MIELNFEPHTAVKIAVKTYIQPFIGDSSAGADFKQVEIRVVTEGCEWSGETIVFPTSDLIALLDNLIVEIETGFEESGGVFKYFEHSKIGIGFHHENELQSRVRFEFKARNIPKWLGPSGHFKVERVFTNKDLFNKFTALRKEIKATESRFK